MDTWSAVRRMTTRARATGDAVMRARQGMKVMMRYGSAWLDVEEQVKAVMEQGLSPRSFLLCTDDLQAETLVYEGHMDRAVRHAISLGLDPMTAIQMSTINTAEHFGVSREIGLIAPGRFGDILIVEDLNDFRPEVVIAKGKEVVRKGEVLVDLPKREYPLWALDSVHLSHTLTAADLVIPAGTARKVRAHVIGVIENQAPTRHLVLELVVQDGQVRQELARDLAKIALVERHQSTGRIQMGLVQGFGFNVSCAVATTMAHDSHQLVVVGTDDEDMAFAANHLAAIGGGQVVVSQGKVLAEVRLQIGGIMSTEPAVVVAELSRELLKAYEKCGCKLHNPNMQVSLMGLVVIPELRISDLGLVDVNRFDFIPLLETIED